MVNDVAYVINRINAITGQAPVKKMLQKMVFLLEKKGVNLNFDYILHFYGPYCSALDAETIELNSEGILAFDYSGYGHKMSILSQDIEPSLNEKQLEIMEDVITRYKDFSPSSLELLTTAIYAYQHTNAKTKTEVIQNVKAIKGEKYRDDEILQALNEFAYFGFMI